MSHSIFQLSTPVAFVVFNRHDCTRRVLGRIKQAAPPLLFVIADGPRSGVEGDVAAVAAVRRIVEEEVDWDCEVVKEYADVNLGLRGRLPSGLTRVFRAVDQAIVLEDDCLPDPTFFRYCEELLDRYRSEPRVMHISGLNLQDGKEFGAQSYYFSRYALPPWGWASWRRAWEQYDVDMLTLPQFKAERRIRSLFRPRLEQFHKQWMFQDAYDDGRDPPARPSGRRPESLRSWDYQWQYAVSSAPALAVHPNVNLIQNIGFGPDATHTRNTHRRWQTNHCQPVEFPLRHPATPTVDEAADARFYRLNVRREVYAYLLKMALPRPLFSAVVRAYRAIGGSRPID